MRELASLLIAGCLVFIFCVFTLAIMLLLIPVGGVYLIYKSIRRTLGRIINKDKEKPDWINAALAREKEKWKGKSESD